MKVVEPKFMDRTGLGIATTDDYTFKFGIVVTDVVTHEFAEHHRRVPQPGSGHAGGNDY